MLLVFFSLVACLKAAPPPAGVSTSRPLDGGTEGLIQGVDTSVAQPFFSGASRTRGSFHSERLPGSPPVQVQTKDVTRWEMVKQTLSGFFRAYLDRDIQGVMNRVARDFQQNREVLRNAIRKDFDAEGVTNLDVELLEYRMTRETVLVRVRWLRSSTEFQNGQPSPVTSANAVLLFGRNDGFRLTSWQGPSPFGTRDSTWQAQVAGSDPQLISGLTSTPTEPDPDPEPPVHPMPTPTCGPERSSYSFSTVAIVVEGPSTLRSKQGIATVPTVLFFDFEAGSVRGGDYDTECGGTSGCEFQGNEDVALMVLQDYTGVDSPRAYLVPRQGAQSTQMVPCNGATSPDQIRFIDVTQLEPRSSFSFVSTADRLYGFQTIEGNYAVASISLKAVDGTYSATGEWKLACERPILDSSAPFSCPISGGDSFTGGNSSGSTAGGLGP